MPYAENDALNVIGEGFTVSIDITHRGDTFGGSKTDRNRKHGKNHQHGDFFQPASV